MLGKRSTIEPQPQPDGSVSLKNILSAESKEHRQRPQGGWRRAGRNARLGEGRGISPDSVGTSRRCPLGTYGEKVEVRPASKAVCVS